MSYSNSSYPGNQPNPDPWGHEPAQPNSQASAQPMSQSSAGYADSQQTAYHPVVGYSSNPQGYAQQAYPGQSADHPTQPIAAPSQHGTPQPVRQDQDNLVKAIFDFGFTRYATPSVVKILYILGIVVGGIGWLLGGLFWIMIGGAMTTLNPYSTGSGGTTLLAVLSWLFGLIPLFFWIIGLRVSLEYALAVVRINQDTKVVREKLEA